MKYNGFDIPDEIIDHYVDKLGWSIAETCDAYLFDTGKIESAEVDAMTKKAAAAGIGKIVDADYKKSERKPKERKINKDKKFILEQLFAATYDFADRTKICREKCIDIEYNGKSYTINLVEHRKKEG